MSGGSTKNKHVTHTCSHAEDDTSWDASRPFPEVDPKLEDRRVSLPLPRLRAVSLRIRLNSEVSLRNAMAQDRESQELYKD